MSKTPEEWLVYLESKYPKEKTYLFDNAIFLKIIFAQYVHIQEILYKWDLTKLKKLVEIFEYWLPDRPMSTISKEDKIFRKQIAAQIPESILQYYKIEFKKDLEPIEIVLLSLVEYDLVDKKKFALNQNDKLTLDHCVRMIQIHYHMQYYVNEANKDLSYFSKIQLDSASAHALMIAMLPVSVTIDIDTVRTTFAKIKNRADLPIVAQAVPQSTVTASNPIKMVTSLPDERWILSLLNKYPSESVYFKDNTITLKLIFATYPNIQDLLQQLNLERIKLIVDIFKKRLVARLETEEYSRAINDLLPEEIKDYYQQTLAKKITPIEAVLYLLAVCEIPIASMPVNENPYSIQTCCKILEAGYVLKATQKNDVTADLSLLHRSFFEYLSHPERLKALRKINHQTLTAALEIIAENPEKPESELLELISNIVPEPEPSIFDQMLDWFNTSTPTPNNNELATQAKVVEDKSSTPATTTMTVTAEQAKALEALSTLETQLFAHAPKIEQQLSHYSLLQRHKGAIESDEALKKHFDKTKSHLQQHFLAMMTLNSGEVQLSTDMVDIAIQISAYVSGKSIPVVGAVVNVMEQVATGAHARERYHYVHYVQQLVPTLDKIELYSECLAIECTYHKRQQIKPLNSMQDDAVLQKMNQFFKDLFSGANERKYFLYLLRTGHDASLLEKQAILDAYQIIGIMMSGEVKPGKRDEEILSQILKMALGDTYQNTALVTLINSVAAPIHMGQIVTTTANSISRDEFDAIKKEVQTLQQQKANNSQSFNAEYVVENNGSLNVVASAQVLVTTPMGKMTVPDAIAWLMKAQIGNDSYIQFSSAILSTYAEQQGINVQVENVELNQAQNREQLGLNKEGERSVQMNTFSYPKQ